MTTHETTTPPAASPPSSRFPLVLGGLMLALLLASLDQTIVATALPAIASDLGGLEHLSWVVTAYLLTSTAATPLYGKLGDLYGRKALFQVAIALFLLGSALTGTARDMTQLILFRAVQGLGAGGLMALVFAIIGELVPPRERGHYQGYFAAVFALASVIGPLAGGLFVDHLSWRWAFYVNLPVALVAMTVITLALQVREERARRAVDYPGAALLVAGTTCLLLVTVWGGSRYPWGSPRTVTLALAGAALLAAFTAWERRAAEPILPPALFRIRVVSVASSLAFLHGAATFGAVVYAPLFLQAVLGASATSSGVQLIPLMMGMITGSTGSGRLITRTGRYKPFPLAGTALLALGYAWLSRLGEGTGQGTVTAAMVLTGLGAGMVMPVLTLAVQNVAGQRHIGTATSAVQFFRTLGAAFGVALFGAVLSNRLSHELARLVPPGALPAGLDPRASAGAAQLAALPPSLQEGVTGAFAGAIHLVFLTAVPVAGAAFLLALLLPEVPLRGRERQPEQGPVTAGPGL